MEGFANERLDFGKMGYGCKHYRRRCKIRAPCCNEVFDCRHCHNESTSMLSSPFDRHELVRSDVKQVISSVCDTEQPVVRVCTNCGVNMGEYFCEVCKFYDDDCAQMFEFLLRHVGVLRQVGVFRKKGTKLYEASLKDEKLLDQWLHC